MLVVMDVLMGQYGNDAISMYALHAIAPTLSSLAPAQRNLRALDALGDHRAETAADPEADEENRQNQENV